MKKERIVGAHLSVDKNTATAGDASASAVRERPPQSGVLIVLGIGLMVLGAIAISATGVSTVASVVFLGWLLVVGGSGLAIHAFWARRWSGFFMQLVAGLLYLLAGFSAAMHPRIGAATLTLVIAVALIAQGASRILTALATRVGGRRTLLVTGIFAVILGLVILRDWPFSGVWTIGLFVGTDMFLYGGWLVSLRYPVKNGDRVAGNQPPR